MLPKPDLSAKLGFSPKQLGTDSFHPSQSQEKNPLARGLAMTGTREGPLPPPHRFATGMPHSPS